MDKQKGKAIDLSLKLGPSSPNDQDNQDPPNRGNNGIRVCRACGTTNTCLWRKGPDGPQTLCNACGLKFMRAQRKARE